MGQYNKTFLTCHTTKKGNLLVLLKLCTSGNKIIKYRYKIVVVVVVVAAVVVVVVVVITFIKPRHSVHILIFLYISIPHPSHSQSTFSNHQSTHLTLLFLSLSGQLWLSYFYRCFCSHGIVRTFVYIVRNSVLL